MGFHRIKFNRAAVQQLHKRGADYKDLGTISQFLTENGKLIPSRITGLSTSQQRELTRQIKIARQLALIPYCDNHRKY